LFIAGKNIDGEPRAKPISAYVPTFFVEPKARGLRDRQHHYHALLDSLRGFCESFLTLLLEFASTAENGILRVM
jgi:hypothetical protein